MIIDSRVFGDFNRADRCAIDGPVRTERFRRGARNVTLVYHVCYVINGRAGTSSPAVRFVRYYNVVVVVKKTDIVGGE